MVAIVVVALIGLLYFFTSVKRNRQEPQPSTTPDAPTGFGYKNNWLTVKTTDPKELAEFLEISKLKPSNWASGAEAAYNDSVFISPAIDGWVVVLGTEITDPTHDEAKELFERLSKRYGECQFFLTHRSVEYHAWVLAKEGEIKRSYVYFAEEGTLEYLGTPTPFEEKCLLVNTFSEESKAEDYWEHPDLCIPDEELVMDIAESWSSVNPRRLDKETEVTELGLVGTYTD